MKVDLRPHFGQFDRRQEIQTSVVCERVDSESYVMELEGELLRIMLLQQFERSNVPIEDIEEQCSQLTVCRVLRSEEVE